MEVMRYPTGRAFTWHRVGASYQMIHGGSGGPGSMRALRLCLTAWRFHLALTIPWTRVQEPRP